MKRILTRRELAEWLAIPENTIANWASAGEGPRYSKVGRHARYRLSDVEKWLDSRAQERDAS